VVASGETPARVSFDSQRNVVKYSTPIEAPNLPANSTAEFERMREILANTTAELQTLRELVVRLQVQTAVNRTSDGLTWPDIVANLLRNECESSPCSNGGSCLNALLSFVCTCPLGFTGIRCESDINECGSSPCRNGGTCGNGIRSFVCKCPPGFTGNLCQTNINECSSSPCSQERFCVDGIFSFTCVCPLGFTGLRCESDINECSSSPCRNGGTCTNVIGSFMCACLEGFVGAICVPGLWIVRYPQDNVCTGVWSFVSGKGCHKASTGSGCATKTFSTGGRSFTIVGGRLTAFQQGFIDAFRHSARAQQ
jgi:hypothetical protein